MLKSETASLRRERDMLNESIRQYFSEIVCDEENIRYLEAQKAKNGEITTEDTVKLLRNLTEEDGDTLQQAM